MPSFDEQRELNIQKNKAMIAALGLNVNPFLPAKPRNVRPPRKPKPAKRKAPTSDSESSVEPPPKFSRVESAEAGGLRRSSRVAQKVVDYSEDGENASQDRSTLTRQVSQRVRSGGQWTQTTSSPKIATQRTQNPKVYGEIHGVSVGTWWETRMACSIDAVHAPTVAGITCGPDGAYSVALSGGYEDDVDLGEGFTYTGSGGRDLKGTKQNPKNLRTAPQSSDQTWDNVCNSALKRSAESKKPVRVIRGFKLQSPYAPETGYRYDGLYTVVKAWQERGLNPKGYLVCKFLFKRLPGQPPLPTHEDEVYESGSDEESE